MPESLKRIRDTRRSHDEILSYVLAPYIAPYVSTPPHDVGRYFLKTFCRFKAMKTSMDSISRTTLQLDNAPSGPTEKKGYTTTEMSVAEGLLNMD